jgi:hypothetical protein
MSNEFQKGRAKTGGRQVGSRNKLANSFLEAMLSEFEEFGAETIRIVRMEHPDKWLLQGVAALLPKEFEVIQGRERELSDNDLSDIINYVLEQKSRRAAEDSDDGNPTSIN